MYPFDDLLSEKTLDDWKQSIVRVASRVGLTAENWIEGGYTRLLVALFGQLGKTAGDVVRIIAASGFLDTAEGVWLTLLARNVFKVERIEATFAKAPLALTLTNAGGGFFEFEAGDITVARSGPGQKTYRNTIGGTLSPFGTLKLDIEADEAGSASNASVGTITTFVTTFLGVSCTNEVGLFGLDEEKDPALRQRCRDSLAALALGGIKRAYEYVAKSAKRNDGSAVGVTRVRVMPPPGDGTLDVYVAGASGAIGVDDLAVVQAEFDAKAVPYGFSATALSTTNVPITAPCTIWLPYSLGILEADARKAVYDALKAYVETLPIGGIIIPPASGLVYWRVLLSVAAKAIPGTLKAQLTSEVDVAIAAGEVPTWGGSLSQTTVVQVTA